jgi:hypothetical protein
VAPPGNQAATEKTNINLYHSENPVYSPKVGPFKFGMQNVKSGASSKLKAKVNQLLLIATGRQSRKAERHL